MPFIYRILFCLAVLLKLPCFAQLRFEHLDIQDGLPATEVYNLYEDHRGYIWAFTEFGIVRHNGKKFVPVCTNIPVSESTIYAIDETRGNELVVGNSRCNLYRIRNDSAILIPGFEAQSGLLRRNTQVIYSIRMDEHGDYWYSTFDYSYFFSPATGESRLLSGTPDYSSGLVFKNIGGKYLPVRPLREQLNAAPARVRDQQGRLLASLKATAEGMERNAIIDSGNRKYFLYTHELYLLNNGVQTDIHIPDPTISFEAAPDGTIWVATNSGLLQFDRDLKPLARYLDHITVSDILFDDMDGIWISTVGHGVFHCRNRQIRSFDDVPDLRGNISMMKVLDGQMVIGTTDGKLYNNTGSTPIPVAQLKDHPTITDVVKMHDRYLIGTKKSFYMLDKNFRTAPVALNTNASVYALAQTKGDTLLALSGTAVFKYYNDSCFALGAASSKTRCILSDSRGTVYVGTSEGLFILSGNTFVLPAFLRILQHERISGLLEDSRHRLWICTKFSGLYILSNDHLSRVPGLPAESLKDLFFLNDSIVVLSTNKGLYYNFLRTINAASSWRVLFANEATSTAIFQNALYLATNSGLTVIPVSGLTDFVPTRFYLNAVHSGSKKLQQGNIIVSHDENDLLFDFDVLDFRSLGTSLYYLLDGPYKAHGPVASEQLHFQNLPPGNYRLKVFARNGNTLNGTKTLTTSITIVPAFWQTGIFLLEIVLLAILLLIIIVYGIYLRIRKREERKTLITRMLVESRLTALKSQINPHFLSNSISAVQELVLSNEIDKANQYLAKFGQLIRNILTYSDRFAANLALEMNIIDLYIDLEQLRFRNKFIFEKRIGKNIRLNEIFIPPLITQPFIENAIWHGLLPLKEKRTPKVILEIQLTGDNLCISVIDNGVGRGKSIMPGIRRESRGTGLIFERIENLNLMYSTNGISITMTDLKDQAGDPAGLRVDIIFPVNVLNSLSDEKNKHSTDR